MMANQDFLAGWDCWVRWDHGFPESPSRAFQAGYAAAAHNNDHGGGARPQVAASDDSWVSYWEGYNADQ